MSNPLSGDSGNPITPEQEERISRYAAGTLESAERLRLEREALESDVLFEALYSHWLMSRPALDRALPGRRPILTLPFRLRARVILPLAAGLALIVGLSTLRRPGPGDAWRGHEAASRAISPVGDVEGWPGRFLWTRARDASSYRFELFDSETRPLRQTVTPDTFLILEATPAWSRGPSGGFWKVTPLAPSGAELPATPPARFRVVAP